ncbi:hypothetical protein [Hydrogenophaga sp.]|uniref:hypothetical protein n=1 Tax=Hydrogenophaga sp. TaxID=1904254 RepID=UPI002ABC4CB6|nr:hypothetical protein [Hydrogenophaga sp.]MDZ4397973.1 hypothetical protein [Hydrogenophaga sp.]
MSKLFKLKTWVTLEGAAAHLSTVLAEPVTVADILQLALDEHLVLSVNLVNKAMAKVGKIKPFSEVELRTIPGLPRKGAPPDEIPNAVQYPEGMLMDRSVTQLKEDTPFLCFDKDVVAITDIWDLTMLGGERIDVEHELQQMLGGPPVDLVNIDGTFLRREDGSYAAIQERLPDTYTTVEAGKKIRDPVRFYPAGGLPDDTPMVVRTNELNRFVAKLSDGEEVNRALGERERTTLLNTVAALLQYSGDKEAAIISAILEAHPGAAGLKERTLQKSFAEAKRSLASG